MALPSGQSWLLSKMRELGYAIDSGACNGIAHMAKQAILAGKIKEFDARLELIHSLDNIAKKVELLKKNLKKEKNLPIDPILEIPAFFEGVALYQSAEKHRYLFEEPNTIKLQDPIAPASIVIPEELKEKDVKIAEPITFTGIYNLRELTIYFDTLRNAIRQINPNLSPPFTMVLGNYNHAITVAYDPIKDEWLFVNANELPTCYIKGRYVGGIAASVISAFSPNFLGLGGETVALSTSIYSTSANEDIVKTCVTEWKNDNRYKKLHEISPRNATRTDENNMSWLQIAARSNDDVEIVKALINNGADVNHVIEGGITPLIFAAQCADAQIVQALVDEKADVNRKWGNNGSTALISATISGNHEAVKVFLQAQVDVNQTNDMGMTALLHAGGVGNIEIIKSLLAAGADVNKKSSGGITPLFFAAQEGHFDIVKCLIEYGAKINIPFKTNEKYLREFAQDYPVHIQEKMTSFLNKNKNKRMIELMPADIAMVMGHDKLAVFLQRKQYEEELSTLKDQNDLRHTVLSKVINMNDEELMKFKELDSVALNLINIQNTYQSKTFFHDKNNDRVRSVEALIRASTDAYQAFLDGKCEQIEDLTKELIKQANEISLHTKKDHKKISPVLSLFFTNSRLAKQIDTIVLPYNKTVKNK